MSTVKDIGIALGAAAGGALTAELLLLLSQKSSSEGGMYGSSSSTPVDIDNTQCLLIAGAGTLAGIGIYVMLRRQFP